MTRQAWSFSDTPRIRDAIVQVTGDSPSDRATLFARVAAALGMDIGERRLYRALRWASDKGLVRLVVAQSWRDSSGYVRVRGRAPRNRMR